MIFSIEYEIKIKNSFCSVKSLKVPFSPEIFDVKFHEFGMFFGRNFIINQHILKIVTPTYSTI